MHRETRQDELNGRQWMMLGTICFVLLIELAAATQLLLERMTGESLSLTSLALAFVVVSRMRQSLQVWIWGIGNLVDEPLPCQDSD